MRYFDFAGGLSINSAYRNNNSYAGESLISDLKQKLITEFSATTFTVHLLNGNASMISNILASSVTGVDSIHSSVFEHHSGILPWLKRYDVQFGEMENLLPVIPDRQYDLFIIVYISNVTGNCFADYIKSVRLAYPDSMIVVDGAQCFGMIPNLDDLGCDAFYFSSSKLASKPGTGVLFASRRLAEHYSDWLSGGGKNLNANFDLRYDDWLLVGTPNFDGICSLFNANLQYRDERPFDGLFADIADEMEWQLLRSSALPAKSIYSFLTRSHIHDISSYLLESGFVVRDGNMCCSLLFERLGRLGCVRFSPGPHSTEEEVKKLLEVLKDAKNKDMGIF